MINITVPGIYDGLPSEVYHGNCTPEPALSSTGAKALAGRDPAAAYRFWFNSPLNPDFQPIRKPEFDIGNAAHLAVLEPDAFSAKVTIIAADDFRTKTAQAERDAAYAAGRVPLLAKDVDMVSAMRKSIFAHPIARHAFSGGASERSYIWVDPEYGVWRKARLDYAPCDDAILRFIPDLKTAASAAPDEFERNADEFGYHQSAAYYMDAIEHFYGVRPRDFYWVVVEKKAPFMVNVVPADHEALEWGRLLNRRALDKFRLCLSRGDYRNPDHWPAYNSLSRPVGFKPWSIKDLEARRDAGDFAANTPIKGPAFHEQNHAAGFAAQAPAAAE